MKNTPFPSRGQYSQNLKGRVTIRERRQLSRTPRRTPVVSAVEGCTRLKLSLVKEVNNTVEEYHLKISDGTLDNKPLNHDEVVTGATKVFFVIDGMAHVTSETSSVTGETVYSYTGGVTLTNHRILLTDTDPTDITAIHPTSTASVAMVFALLVGEVKEELDSEGNTILKLVEYHCGNKVVKWCPPQSFYFLPV